MLLVREAVATCSCRLVCISQITRSLLPLSAVRRVVQFPKLREATALAEDTPRATALSAACRMQYVADSLVAATIKLRSRRRMVHACLATCRDDEELLGGPWVVCPVSAHPILAVISSLV
mmetsp:Transcript_35584/g.88546  ORF Transcript_35584/g.88546 Transcript_35584/m.88546 type:complete len:120 (+) Transcript_35584:18-377(+)